MIKFTNFIIGIDGGNFDYLKILLKRNMVPNFKKLIENGFSSELKVPIPPVTIPSWPCLFSGLTPEQLGFYYFTHPKKGLFNSNFWKDFSIFSLLKKKIFVLNVPGTYPAWPITGEMITGMLSPSISCYPPELKVILKNNWIIDGENVEESFEAFEKKSKFFLKKIEEDFDLMVYVIRIPDNITHRAHVRKERIFNLILKSYIKIDKFLGELLKNENIENIFLFSDHGLRFYGRGFYIRRWLEKKGLLYINEPKGKKIISILLKLYDFIRDFINSSVVRNFSKKILNLIGKKH
ncbi:MAG: alkaline phosphatase family protein, partial [Promethearchaeota archaeon]